MEKYWEQLKDWFMHYWPSILAAIAILVVGWFLTKFVVALFTRSLGKAKVDETLTRFLAKLVFTVLMLIVVISALDSLGVETTSFVAILGAAGLAVGLALQGNLANFAAGVLLIIFRPFKIGDVIEVAGELGKVKDVQIFATHLLRPDNKRVIIPNNSVISGNITNYTVEGTLRADMTFGISYGDDIKQAKQIIHDILAQDERVLKDPAPVIIVAALADSSVNLAVRPWVKTADYLGVIGDTTEAVKYAFDAQGVSIPFPQRDVHMHQVA